MASKKELQSKEILIERLDTLLAPFRGEKGKIPKNVGYLKTPKGKQILKIVCELVKQYGFSITDAEKKLERGRTGIWSALKVHAIESPWKEAYQKKCRKTTSMTGILQFPEVLTFVRDALRKGILKDVATKAGAVNAIQSAIESEFKDFANAEKVKITKTCITKHIDEIVWDKDTLQILTKYISEDFSEEMFMCDMVSKYNFYIPETMVLETWRWAKADREPKKVTQSSTLPGVLRLIHDTEEVPDFKVPVSTSKEPLDLGLTLREGMRVVAINAPLIGLVYDRYMENNPLRCAMEVASRIADAERTGADVVLMTGGLLYLPLKQSSREMATHRAAYSGMEIDMDVLDTAYCKYVEKSRAEGRKEEEIIYQLASEAVDNLMNAFTMVMTKGDGTPRYTIPVYITFGLAEEEVIEVGANAELRYKTITEQARVKGEIKKLTKEINRRELAEETPEYRRLHKELKEYQSIDIRTKRTNEHPVHHKEMRSRMTAWLASRIEAAIPHSKVIGVGNTSVQIGDQVIEVRQARNDQVSNITNDFIVKEGNNRTRTGYNPSMYLLCSRATRHYEKTVIESTDKTQSGHIPVVALPVMVNDSYVKRALQRRGVVAKRTNEAKLFRHEEFSPGMVVLRYVAGEWISESYSIKALLNRGAIPGTNVYTKQNRKKSFVFKDAYVNTLVFTDVHVGNAYSLVYQDVQGGRLLDQVTATFEMLRRENGLQKIHSVRFFDDFVHAHNHTYEQEPHRNKLSEVELQDMLTEKVRSIESMMTTAPQDASLMLERLKMDMMMQSHRHGRLWVQEQFDEVFERILGPAVDIWISVLKKARASGVHFVGTSSLRKEYVDSCDIGVISFGTGNHFGHTVESHVMEGAFAAHFVRALLQGNPAMRQFEAELKSLIRAPQHGSVFYGIGHLQTPYTNEYGFLLRGDPSRKSNANGFALGNMLKNVISRGDFSEVMRGKFCVHLMGDVHKYAEARIGNDFLLVSPAGTQGDSYGTRGFARSHAGVTILSLPAHGSDAGPLIITPIMKSMLHGYFAEGKRVDLDLLIPAPL